MGTANRSIELAFYKVYIALGSQCVIFDGDWGILIKLPVARSRYCTVTDSDKHTFIFIEESLTVAIRPPKYNSQGFTLVEMLATIVLAGIIMGFALPSLLSLSKPLRDGSLEFKAQLSLIRSKAIASNQAYRIRPKYLTAAEVTAAHPNRAYPQAANNFIVEYAANCQVTTYGSGTPNGWMAASQLDLDLPGAVGVDSARVGGSATTAGNWSYPLASGGATASPPVDAPLNWSICFDNRGIVSRSVSVTFKDFQGNNRAASASIDVSGVGSVDITTKDKSDNPIPLSGDNPVY
jgi:prepilin-type N-terminal cleavage/methylation domain-containing protein